MQSRILLAFRVCMLTVLARVPLLIHQNPQGLPHRKRGPGTSCPPSPALQCHRHPVWVHLGRRGQALQTHTMQNPLRAPQALGAAGSPSPPHHLSCFTGQGGKVQSPSAQATLPGAAARNTLRALNGGDGAGSEVSACPRGARWDKAPQQAALRPGRRAAGPASPSSGRGVLWAM